MQQGLAFYQLLLLLKVLEIFNYSVFHVRFVFYAPHHFTYKHTMEQNKKQSPNSTNITKQGQKVVLLIEKIAWI
jgi:hypothetical protein